MATINGVECTELLGSGNNYTRIYYLDADDLADLLVGLYGTIEVVGEDYERVMPMPFEEGSFLYPAGDPAIEFLACDGEDATGRIHYKKAKVTVKFGPLDQDDENDDEPWTTISSRTTRSYLPIAAWGLKWASDSVKLDSDQVAGYPITTIHKTLTRKYVGVINEAALAAYAGSLNEAVFLGYPIGCVAFDDFSTEEVISEEGKLLSYTLVIEISIRSVPWHHMWRPSAAGFEEPVRASNGAAIVVFKDFSQIGRYV